MARKLGNLDRDNFIERYKAGEALYALANEARVDFRTARKTLVAAGVEVRTRSGATRASRPVPDALISERYVAGDSTGMIAEEVGLSQGAIRNSLRRSGILVRSPSSRNRLRFQRLSDSERSRVTRPFAMSRSGVTVSAETLRKRAATNETRQNHVSFLDRKVADGLVANGRRTVLQKAIGPYNVDVALPDHSVAVEIFGGLWHATPSKARRDKQRLKDILHLGWSVIIVWHDGDRYPVGPGAIKAVEQFTDSTSGQPSPVCQYRVIRGDGEILAATGYDGDDLPDIPSPTRHKGWRGELNPSIS